MGSGGLGERKNAETGAEMREGHLVPRTGEAIIGTASGIVRAGTVKRQTIEEARNAEQFLAVSRTPWAVGGNPTDTNLSVRMTERSKS